MVSRSAEGKAGGQAEGGNQSHGTKSGLKWGLVGGIALGVIFPPSILGSAAVVGSRPAPSPASCASATTTPSSSRSWRTKPSRPGTPVCSPWSRNPGEVRIRKALRAGRRHRRVRHRQDRGGRHQGGSPGKPRRGPTPGAEPPRGEPADPAEGSLSVRPPAAKDPDMSTRRLAVGLTLEKRAARSCCTSRTGRRELGYDAFFLAEGWGHDAGAGAAGRGGRPERGPDGSTLGTGISGRRSRLPEQVAMLAASLAELSGRPVRARARSRQPAAGGGPARDVAFAAPVERLGAVTSMQGDPARLAPAGGGPAAPRWARPAGLAIAGTPMPTTWPRSGPAPYSWPVRSPTGGARSCCRCPASTRASGCWSRAGRLR